MAPIISGASAVIGGILGFGAFVAMYFSDHVLERNVDIVFVANVWGGAICGAMIGAAGSGKRPIQGNDSERGSANKE